ncbi:DEAD/DEAH box helicase [Limibaculum sp. M0105]|uniref:DEAD-box ATP-dependent RNA helicase RhpA n=1 Tax=Thermohalobaculum xanthum TaxID=2753746 RepID=A0A8J7M6Q6_9RHOB|nr:DEAD/DEAH box helicase [Thermohalobaculum xanthum]MBK0399276.1 DEAD/DEAH box helicase [Thermohalobaculum xanthum]
MTTFEALGLDSSILRAIAALGFEAPTPIQRDAIPHVLEGRDLMGLAQTGTGKTAAFGLPLVQHLMAEKHLPEARTVRALVLAPTRELVNQIADNLRAYTRRTDLRVATVVGGASINNQIRMLSRGTDLLVATPGRLLDLVERRAVRLDTARFLVLDEADQMLDLGFIHALRKIATLVGTPRQTLLFSATMPRQMEELSRAYLSDPVRVQVSPPGRAADLVRQSVHFVEQSAKTDLLKRLIAEDRDSLSLVFSRTKHGAERLMKQLVAAGFKAGSIHGNKSQGQRERAIAGFRKGEIRVLVATDVAARGIDIPGVSHVYNYDLPEVAESYVHRIGRTARAGADGEAVAFCTSEDIGLLRAIEKLTGVPVAVASGEAPPEPRGGARKGPRRGRPSPQGAGRPAGHGAQQKPRRHESASAPSAAKPARRWRPARRRASATVDA